MSAGCFQAAAFLLKMVCSGKIQGGKKYIPLSISKSLSGGWTGAFTRWKWTKPSSSLSCQVLHLQQPIINNIIVIFIPFICRFLSNKSGQTIDRNNWESCWEHTDCGAERERRSRHRANQLPIIWLRHKWIMHFIFFIFFFNAQWKRRPLSLLRYSFGDKCGAVHQVVGF